MQQCQYGALILMSAHFAQRGREPVNLDFYWRGSLHLPSTQVPASDTRRRQSAPIVLQACIYWPVVLHIDVSSQSRAHKCYTLHQWEVEKRHKKEQRLYVGQLPLILMETVVVKKKKKPCIPVLSISLT